MNRPVEVVSLRGLAIAVLAAAIAVALLWLPVRRAMEDSRRSHCTGHLSKIMIALHTYHDHFKSFPPAYTRGPDGRPWHSWRALILPYLIGGDVHSEYRLDEPWDGPHNKLLITRRPDVFACPSNDHLADDKTPYLAVVGAITFWPEDHALAIPDVHDGTSNTVAIVEDSSSDVIWTEPRDVSYANRDLVLERTVHPGVHAGLADGSVRMISTTIDRETWNKLLTAGSGSPFHGLELPIGEISSPPLPPLVDAESLVGVKISASMEEPLADGTSIWCATMQLAWDRFRDEQGGSPIVLEGAPPLANLLNNRRFPVANLDPAAIVVEAGLVGDSDSVLRLQERLRVLLPGRSPPDFSDYSPDSLFVYSWLKKFLPFAHKFEVVPLPFGPPDAVEVEAFGIGEVETREGGSPFISQVEILDYRSDDDFILQLQTAGSKKDRIVLAKTQPLESLIATWDEIVGRISSPSPGQWNRMLEAGDRLAVPVLQLGVAKSYSDLVPRKIVGTVWTLRATNQDIQFRLDQTGAWLISSAEVIGENGHDHPAQVPRKLFFNRPFLIALQERDGKEPYFVGWIGNTALMTKR